MANYKAIKFEMNSKESVELTFDKPLERHDEKYNKTTYWYGIKETINGSNGFNATAKLHETIQALNAKAGSTICIEKVNNGSFTFFQVDGTSLVKDDAKTNVAPAPTQEKKDVLLSEVKVEVPMEARMNTLEKEIERITQDLKSIKDNIKTKVDGDIPF